jgi:flagellar FliL protein
MPEKSELESGIRRNRKSMFLIVPILLLFLAALILTLYIVINEGAWENLIGSGKSSAAQSYASAESSGDGGSLGPLIKLNNFVVNVTDGERTRYLKAGITLEGVNSQTKREIKQRKPQIRDAVLSHASNKNFRELRDLQGKQQLQAEIQHKINSILQRGKVRRVFFTEFVIQ